MKSLSHYLQLYTLHFIEQHTPHQHLVHIRLSAVQYLLADLPDGVEALWQHQQIVQYDLIQQTTQQRLQQLLNDESSQQRLLATRWQPYTALRQHHALPTLDYYSPTIPTASFDRRLDQAERMLRLMKTTLEVANAGLILWQTWQASRNERQQLLAAIRATLVGQAQALEASTAQDFITGYLAAHTHDPVHQMLFDNPEDNDNG